MAVFLYGAVTSFKGRKEETKEVVSVGAKNHHYSWLPEYFESYVADKPLRFDQYSAYHMRIVDSGTVCLDIWTTGKYYVVETNYHLYGERIVERAGEKGLIPVNDKKRLQQFLDKMFFPMEVL